MKGEVMPFSWRTPLMQWALAMLVIFVMCDIAFLIATSITVAYEDLMTLAASVFALAVIAALMHWIARRLATDDNPVGQKLCHFATSGHTLILAGTYIVVMSAAAAPLSYFVVTTGFPLADVHFSSFDKALGFDWLGFLEWTNQHPWFAKFLTISYFSSAFMMGLLLVVLSWLGQIRNLQHFIALFALTACAVLIISGLFPAYGPYHFYNPDPSLSSNMSGNAGSWHIEIYRALVTGQFHHFDWKTTEGIVSMPSFHTILAIITAYGLREVRFLAWPSYALGFAVIVSTLPEGGHYLVDVLAGGTIAVIAIIAVRAIDGQSTRPANLFPSLPIYGLSRNVATNTNT